ncbi:MAG: NUDIX domain-containing protein [Gammaproteobacteria bacterium]|nr:NUDIX domain-containing protein [Gammaproteobacteria bacterium]MDH4313642.1 NUDIX domain-containing protein [Gammaproteobacteria bacterium]MDH5213855.1 NUDIX domain-containing protein [Gammaproteobacteria bacterium]MDH5500374.1 NUDIX domain-containing protein [Gammaproteobacteria bacterium]
MASPQPGNPPRPRRSSTVLLIRDGESTPEVLMLKRHAKSAFGAVYVFPGGVVDACDSCTGDRCGAIGREQAADLLGTDDALDYFSAAVREVFEETGVLLANCTTASDPQRFACDADRRCLIEGDVSWDEFLRLRKLTLSSQDLHYFAHWITPISEPKRFSTRFFLARMPEGQQASHDGHELTDSCWMTAADILEAQRAGQMRLIYPTYRTLKDIVNKKTVTDVIDWAVERQRSGVARVLPAIVDIDGRDKVVLPGDPRYPVEEQE